MKKLEKNIVNIYGQRGGEWVASLPRLTQLHEREWELSDLKPVHNLTYNYILSGFRGSVPIILKISMEGVRAEAAALKAFEGFGAVKVLERKEDAILLERIVPSTSLKSYFSARDQESIEIACEVIRKLHRAPIPTSHNFPSIKDWLKALDNSYAEIDARYILKACDLRDKLMAKASKEVLLHGDLHHDNILQHGKDWVVIDPKGVIGEAEYEVAAFIRNPIPELMVEPDAKDIIDGRIKEFARILSFDEARIRGWCYVQGVLSMIWAVEDGADYLYFKRFVDAL